MPDDEVFRKLCQDLIARKYTDPVLPDRPGPDCGIDASARDEDGLRVVFSFKFYENVNDMLKALGKDADHADRYRKADPDSIEGQLWRGVEKIQIWTNLKMNPGQIRKAEGFFEGIGLEAKVRNREKIEQLLEEYPAVKNRFGGEVEQLLLTAEQFRARQSKAFRDYYRSETPFLGRADGVEAIRAQLADPERLIVVVKAPGGMGKTRFLLELSERIPERTFHYLKRPTDNLARYRNELYAALGDVIVIDEGQGVLDLLGPLAEYLEQERGPDQHPKIVVAIRPDDERGLRGVVQPVTGGEGWRPVELGPIDDLGPLLSSWGYTGAQAFAIRQASAGNPMWATIAHQAIQKGYPLIAATQSDIAEGYLTLRLDGAPHRSVLGRLAAVMPVNVEDDAQMAFLGGEAGLDPVGTRAALSILVSAGLVEQGGRIRKVVPDLIADYLLRSRLIGQDGTLTGWEKPLLESCDPSLVGNAVRNVARVEASEGRGFLRRLFDEEITGVPDMNNGLRITALDVLAPAAHVEPLGALAFVQAILNFPRNADVVEVPYFAEITIPHTFRHEDVLRSIPDFLQVALVVPECADEALTIFESLALQEGPGPRMGKGAKEVFLKMAGFEEGRLTGFAETLFAAIERRVEELVDEGPTGLIDRLSLLASGAGEFLHLRLDTFRVASHTIYHWSGTLFLSEPVRALRGRVLKLLEGFADHPDPAVRAISTTELERAYSSLAQAGKGSDEQERALDEEERALNELSLRIIAKEENFRVLRPLAERVFLTLGADCRRSNKVWAREAAELLSRKPDFDLKARFFGPVWWGRGRVPISRRTEAKRLVRLPERSFLDTLVAWSEEAGEISGTLIRTVEQYGLDRPAKAKRILMAEVARGVRPLALPYVVALLGAVRARLGSSIIAEMHRRGEWSLAAVYKDFWWFATAATPNAAEDWAFVSEALRLGDEARRPALIAGMARATDGEGNGLFAVYEDLVECGDRDQDWPAMVEGLTDFFAHHPEANKGRLHKLFLRLASLPGFFMDERSDYRRLNELVVKAAQSDPAFLAEFLTARIDAFTGGEDERKVWPYYAQQFAASKGLTREIRLGALRRVVERTLREGEDRYLSKLTDLIRDVAGGDVSLLGSVYEEQIVPAKHLKTIERAIELLDRFGFSDATLDVYERLLSLAKTVPGAKLTALERKIASALSSYSSISVGGEVPSVFLERRRMIEDRLGRPRASSFRRLYLEVKKRNEEEVNRHIRSEGEYRVL